MRFTFGGQTGDYVMNQLTGQPLPGRRVTMWSAETGGTQYTDLLLNGGAVSSVMSAFGGRPPVFQGPDDVTEMWAQVDGATVRTSLDPHDTEVIARVDQAVADVQALTEVVWAPSDAAADAAINRAEAEGRLTGSAVARHEANAAFPRPAVFGSVIWVGTVYPTNIVSGDVYFNAALEGVEPPTAWQTNLNAETLALTNLDEVAQWNNDSNPAASPAQATAGLRPIYYAAASGEKAFVRFNGSKALTIGYGSVLAGASTSIIALRATSLPGNASGLKYLFDGIDSTSRRFAQFFRSAAGTTDDLRFGSTSTGGAVGAATPILNVWAILTFLHQADGTTVIRRNGLQLFSGGTGVVGAAGLTLGNRYDQGPNGLVGDVFAFKRIGSALTLSTISQIENVLAGKLGISMEA